MPPAPHVPANAYKKSAADLSPIDIQNIQSNHHLQQQQAGSPERAEPIIQAAHCNSIEEGTVDFLLQTGSGGCEEWDMHADEVAEGLNYYGFLNPSTDVVTEVSSTESCIHQPDHMSNPIPVGNAPQYNRQ